MDRRLQSTMVLSVETVSTLAYIRFPQTQMAMEVKAMVVTAAAASSMEGKVALGGPSS